MVRHDPAQAAKERGWTTGAELDAQRRELAREITRLFGNEQKLWQNCSHRQCQRERSCIAPRGECPMQPPYSEEEVNAAWPAVLAEVRRAIDERLAELGETEDADED